MINIHNNLNLLLIKMAKDEKPGLWANIRAKKLRGEAAADPGEKDYPDSEQWEDLTKESSIKVANNLMRLIVTKSAESPAWQRSEGKNPEGGLNRRGIKSYKEENPDSNLQMAVTTDPSKLDPDSKAAKRRKSFCARMGGMPGPMQDEKGRPTRKALSLRKWNC